MEELVRGGRLVLRRLGPEQLADVTRIYAECPTFFRVLTGATEVPEAYVREDMTGVPPGFDPADKYFMGVYLAEDDVLVGLADFLVGWPEPGRGCLGLLLVSERWQGRGLGRDAAELVERYVRERHGVREVRLGVELVNIRASAFWRAVGYQPTGEHFEHEVLGRTLRAELLKKGI